MQLPLDMRDNSKVSLTGTSRWAFAGEVTNRQAPSPLSAVTVQTPYRYTRFESRLAHLAVFTETFVDCFRLSRRVLG